jgi:hypothetical protein
MSSEPAMTIGLLATTPTVRPRTRAKPMMMFSAKWEWISRKSALSTILAHDDPHVVGLTGLSGMISLSERSILDDGVEGAAGRVLHVVGGQEGEELAADRRPPRDRPRR